jgi:hypothetical protein
VDSSYVEHAEIIVDEILCAHWQLRNVWQRPLFPAIGNKLNVKKKKKVLAILPEGFSTIVMSS